MKKIFKKLAIATFVCLSPLSLLACTDSNPDPVDPNPPVEVTTYTITFNTNGGSSVTNIEGESGIAITMPTAPTKTNNTFAGWFTDEACTVAFTATTMPSTNMTVYAKWTPYPTVTFETSGGTDIPAVVGLAGTTFAMPANPTKDYFTFGGWYTDKACTTPCTLTTIPASGATIYAKWNAASAGVISFDTNGGSKLGDIHGTEGDTIVLPTEPTKEGFTFGGWYTDSTLNTAFTQTTYTTTNVTLYAKWNLAAGKFSVSYHVADSAVDKVSENGKLSFENTLLPEGTALEGWYYDEACTQKATENTTLTKNVSLYASFYTKGLVFDGAKVVSYNGSSKYVYIPAVINGVALTEIGNSAFYGNKNIIEVYIPESVKTIDAYAFYKCEYLGTANLAKATTSIGEYAFFNCKRLKSIETLGETKTIGMGAFTGCELLKDFTMSSKLEQIGDRAFADCKSLTVLAFPEALTSLGDSALSQCTGLKTLSFGSKLASLGESALAGVDSLSSFSIASANTAFSYENDCLMNSNKTTLIKYFGQATTFNVPASLTTIKAYAFSGNTTIKSIDISTVANVELGALANMSALESLTLKDLSEGYVAYYFGALKGEDNASSNAYVSKNLKNISFKNDVLNISSYAFYGISLLETVNGIASVVSIDEYAFAYTNIKTFTVTSKINEIASNAFYASSLESFTIVGTNNNYSVTNNCLYNADGTVLKVIPANVDSVTISTTATTLEANTFNGVYASELVIPNNITTIARGALYGIIGLKSLTVPFMGDGKNEQYMHYLFGSTLTISDELNEDGETVKNYDFDTVDNIPASLETIVVGGTATEVTPFGFAYFEGLKNITLPQTVTKYCEYAFARCGFINLVVPTNVKTIGELAFAYNFDLKTIEVSAPTIEKAAFGYNLSLKTAVFKEGVTALPEYCFMPYSETSSTTGERGYYSSLTTVELPSSVKSIGDGAFLYAGYYGTTTNNFEIKYTDFVTSQLETIGEAAFEESAIANALFPASLKSVGRETFFECKNLKTVTFGSAALGSKLESIGGVAFAYCESLESVYIYKNVTVATMVPTLTPVSQNGNNFYPFYGCSSTYKIYVPAASVDFYKATTGYTASTITAIK